MPYRRKSDGAWLTQGVDFREMYDTKFQMILHEFRCQHGEWPSKCFRCIVDRKAQPRGHYVNREQGV